MNDQTKNSLLNKSNGNQREVEWYLRCTEITKNSFVNWWLQIEDILRQTKMEFASKRISLKEILENVFQARLKKVA